VISKTKETFDKGFVNEKEDKKNYVIPLYGYNCLEEENVYCLLTSISSLKKEDFYFAYHKVEKSKYKKDCNYCKLITEHSQQIIEENESFLSLVSFFQYSDGHLLVITKEHRADISELTKKE